jgi:hypothetical protein
LRDTYVVRFLIALILAFSRREKGCRDFDSLILAFHPENTKISEGESENKGFEKLPL